jgi:hypothetical protein
MSDTFNIVALPDGRFRAEKIVARNQTTTYASAVFRTKREASDWIERQGRAAQTLRIDYVVAQTDGGTYRVTLARSDRGTPEMLGEYSTLEDANRFIQRMRELDAGPTHGHDPR